MQRARKYLASGVRLRRLKSNKKSLLKSKYKGPNHSGLVPFLVEEKETNKGSFFIIIPSFFT